MITISEKDWSAFRRLRDVALERFCERVLTEAAFICSKSSGSAHDRYRNLFALIQDHDRELASAFDDPRRSCAIMHLSLMMHFKLLTGAELAPLSEEFRRAVDFSIT